ncbi:methylated-DNA--[protein]-cysteine S-methyltransferase [Vagococcus xieshaowenii]|uniref:methylated-DNA--[protein]-cysteine S-methyltransferase n=1 Tax=Vagococcus xieshaowenii TaxID=2562451 RepID=A0AAJ5JQ73_9ENTE|nr:methylated-DNA--[protein]-cysteine S-methyltransferase [Vagococcus xieshaowenii]QCA27896.1 methylated-DNA--[protein]-cysteine S-methyltransferase [Vagococcus xieshaowenii]TFZ39425.1 methylated-DNA--[protein]-cysteine S-methyltransferase [Vagococcus xieshaowenii]
MKLLYYDELILTDKRRVYLLVSDKGWVAISSFDASKEAFLSEYVAYHCQLASEQVMPYKEALRRYVEGDRQAFDQPIDFLGRGSEFQRAVWQALQMIPYGTTTTYGEIAQQINRPKAVRAVGTAIACNPLRIVIPCHRVIRADGSIGGYNGGIEMKHYLLALEKTL